MDLPILSVIIPVYNRGELVASTLESVRRAAVGLDVETIVVDDGSAVPAAEAIARLGFVPTILYRQPNMGLLFARLAGLERACGRYTLFLDSDDLVGPEKFHRQIAAMESAGADLSYTDTARCALEGGIAGQPLADQPCADTTDAAEFFIAIQPPPHSPIFRTDYLRRIVSGAIIPPSQLYNPVAEIWFYHNAAIRPARVIKVAGPHTIVGIHPTGRLTDHWERLGVASLAVLEAFVRACADAPETAWARQLVAEKSFQSWRRLPRGFSREFACRELAVWRRLNRGGDLNRLGGRGFQALARAAGPVTAGRILKLVQNRTYESCRTMDTPSFLSLLETLPPAGVP